MTGMPAMHMSEHSYLELDSRGETCLFWGGGAEMASSHLCHALTFISSQ